MSFWLTSKRIARYGLLGFIRNAFVSLAAVVIMTITLSVFATLIIAGAAGKSVLHQLTEKVDVTVYFIPNAGISDMQHIESTLQALPQVSSTTFVSRDDALANFQERHKSDPLTIQALKELDDNPLGASIEVHAKDPSQYESIAQYVSDLQTQGKATVIDRVNFYENKSAINRLSTIIDMSRKIGLALAIFFGLASLLITFNTLRLAIYTSKDEIEVMTLVGASPWYIRGPFAIAGVLYGIIAGMLVILILYPVCLWLGPSSQAFLGSFNVYEYYQVNLPMLSLLLVGIGVILGSLSSVLAIRRYLL